MRRPTFIDGVASMACRRKLIRHRRRRDSPLARELIRHRRVDGATTAARSQAYIDKITEIRSDAELFYW